MSPSTSTPIYYNKGEHVPTMGSDSSEPRAWEWHRDHTIVVFEGAYEVVPEDNLQSMEASSSADVREWAAQARTMNQEGDPVHEGRYRIIPRYVVLINENQMDDLLEELTAGALCFDLFDVEVAKSFPALEHHARDLTISFVYNYNSEEDDEDN
jgi:hypothetical protein